MGPNLLLVDGGENDGLPGVGMGDGVILSGAGSFGFSILP